MDVPDQHTWRETLLPPPPAPTAPSAVVRAARPIVIESEELTDSHGQPVKMEMNWNDSLADFVPDEDVHEESIHSRQTTPRGPHPSRPTLPSPRWDERLGSLR